MIVLAPLFWLVSVLAWLAGLLFRALWWVVMRPRLLAALCAAGLLTWLLYPLADTLGGSMTPIYVIGGVGGLAGVILVGRALLEQRAFDRGLDAAERDAYDAEPDVEHRAPAWADE